LELIIKTTSMICPKRWIRTYGKVGDLLWILALKNRERVSDIPVIFFNSSDKAALPGSTYGLCDLLLLIGPKNSFWRVSEY
jgi:hypothetical protein